MFASEGVLFHGGAEACRSRCAASACRGHRWFHRRDQLDGRSTASVRSYKPFDTISEIEVGAECVNMETFLTFEGNEIVECSEYFHDKDITAKLLPLAPIFK